MRLKLWHCIVMISIAVLATFYPVLFAGYNSVDDVNMVNGISQSGPINLAGLFFPDRVYYYRPLTIVTYLWDREVWGMVPSFMHLENVILHLGCSLLVYAISRQFFFVLQVQGRWPALLSSLLFALHPITTESVCWISGRTDVLMSLFLLLGVWLGMLGLSRKKNWFWFLAAICIFIAPLAKEVAVFVLPGLLWMVLVYPGEGNLVQRSFHRWSALLLSAAACFGYLAWRSSIIASDSGVAAAIQGVTDSGASPGGLVWLDKLRVATKVYGFYFKKLLVPWPQNFAIVEVSDWYLAAGVLLVLVLVYLMWRRDLVGAFGLTAFCMLSPALLVVFGQMTWTPVAERYLYASAAFFAPVLSGAFCFPPNRETGRNLVLSVPLMLVLVFALSTGYRAWIWQDNVRLYQNTVQQSPTFAPARSELASALIAQGRVDEAQEILAGMQAQEDMQGYINDDLNLAGILIHKGQPEQARELLLKAAGKNPKRRYELLQRLVITNLQILDKSTTPELREGLLRENVDSLLEMRSLRPDPFINYRIGKQYLLLGDRINALSYFRKALKHAPEGAHYREAARRIVENLSVELDAKAKQ